jgi:predicted nucleic acid-binding protein
MILLDTNVLIYALEPTSPFYKWSRETIASGVTKGGVAINAISLAEVCVGDAEPETVADRIRSWGVEILDVPVVAAELCARAYKKYRQQRQRDSGKAAPILPLPDFFIGSHAIILDCALATADTGRFKTYFPIVKLVTP